ncbi:hypothetical protein IC620_10075 [Hazenella sp. IB182357]|uniref:Barstar (barnase inhibitor) domain-containing protein n=1 Tax=Polycladospora coralii TaxID=2771432 RepID=A0A926NAU8_9BACL|nr:hypothetical protein [Polycladospora coralii]MBD1372702.1 hypothetical protein [Polycladospora coralii]
MNKMINQLTELQGPYFHLFVGKEKEFNEIYTSMLEHKPQTRSFYVEGEKCKTYASFDIEFSTKLDLDISYFETGGGLGEALNQELEWEGWNGFVLMINHYWEFLQYENSSVRRILTDSVYEWVNGRDFDPECSTPPMPFHVVFQCDSGDEEELIEKMKSSNIEEYDIIRSEDIIQDL